MNGVPCDLPKSEHCRIISNKSSPIPLTLFLRARFNIFYLRTGAVFLPMHATASAHLMVLNFVTIINLLLVERVHKTESCIAKPHMTVPLLHIPEQFLWSQLMPSVPATQSCLKLRTISPQFQEL